MSNLKAKALNLSKHKALKGTVTDVLGDKVAVRLVNNGVVLTGVEYYGGIVSEGDEVLVDYSSGKPIIYSRGSSAGVNRTVNVYNSVTQTGDTPAPGEPGELVDHGSLTGLSDDDHAQYHNDTRAEGWLAGVSIDGHSDVVVDSVADNELLAYDSATSNWINQTPTEAGFAAVATSGDHGDLSGLSDDDHPQYIKHSLADAANDFLVASADDAFVKKTLAETGAILEGDIQHDNLQSIDANEHVDHTGVSISAGTGLTGGGTIAANRTISLSHLGLESLADPDADRIMFWDDSEGALKWLTLGTNLSIDATTINAAGGSATDHGALTGLSDDDHNQYLLANGTRELSADWDAGAHEIRAETLESDVATGTAPLTIASTTKVTNLNADKLDDQEGTYYLDSTNFTGTNWTDLTDSGETTLHKHAQIKQTKSITVEDPGSAEDITIFFTSVAITISEMRAVLIGSSTPSVTWTIRHGSDRSAAGNQVVTGGTTTTSTTTGSDVTSFNDATIPADSFVWLETTAKSGTVDELHITMVFTED